MSNDFTIKEGISVSATIEAALERALNFGYNTGLNHAIEVVKEIPRLKEEFESAIIQQLENLKK